MKRHDALAFLSREHHGALILARLLQKGAPVYKGLPTDAQGKSAYALQFYQDELIAHFAAEEKFVLAKIRGISDKLDSLSNEVMHEHTELRLLFEMISHAAQMEDHLNSLGSALEKHIRKEERELFPLIQDICNENILADIGRSFTV